MFNELHNLVFFGTAVASSKELLREHDIVFLEFGASPSMDLFLDGRRVEQVQVAC